MSFYMRPTGIEESPDRGGGGHYFARRVRIREEIKMEDLCDSKERELFKVLIMIMNAPEVEDEAIGKQTRAGSRRKEDELAEMPDQTKEDGLMKEDTKEEKMEEMPRLEDMVKEKEEERPIRPEGS